MTNLGLEGKVALITGGASGIGAATAQLLCEEGASVAVVDRDGTAADEVAAGLPGPALGLAADVSDEDAVQSAVDATVERFGRIDLHHLNAGIPGSLAPFEELTVADFEQVIGVNLTGVFLGLRAGHHGVDRQPARQRRPHPVPHVQARGRRAHALRGGARRDDGRARQRDRPPGSSSARGGG